MRKETLKYKFVLNTGHTVYGDRREALEKTLLKSVKIISQEEIK